MKDIDIGNISTFPKELVNCINNDIYVFEKYNLGKAVEDDTVECMLAPSQIYDDRELMILHDNVFNILMNHRLVGYHVSRILTVDDIWKNGLIMLEFDSYSRRIIDVLRKHQIDENVIKISLEEIRRMYDGALGERKNRVCFFAPKPKLYDGNFDIFGVNYGGEIAERALQKIKPVWSVLTSVGIPVCVKFRFHIEDMYDYQFKEIVLSFIKKIAYKILMDYDYCNIIGQHIKKSVPPQDIIEVSEIKICDYFE